jgi:hypothetical protein
MYMDTKEVIRSRNLKRDRQHNVQKEKDNGSINIKKNTKGLAKQSHTKQGWTDVHYTLYASDYLFGITILYDASDYLFGITILYTASDYLFDITMLYDASDYLFL